MAGLKGKREWVLWKNGKDLTRKQAMLAMCYDCNGLEDGREDCLGKNSCALYLYAPYGTKKSNLKPVSDSFVDTKSIKKEVGRVSSI